MERTSLDPNEPMSMTRTIIIADFNSNLKTLQINIFNKTIQHLITRISQITRIPEQDLRCTYHNKELLLHASEPIINIGIQNGDTIYTKLRLKGGSQHPYEKDVNLESSPFKEGKNITEYGNEDSLPLERQIKDAYFQKAWKALSLTKEFYLGDEIPDDPNAGKIENKQATSEDIDFALRNILQDETHIIHPDIFSLNSIFSKDKEKAREAILDKYTTSRLYILKIKTKSMS